MASVDAGIGERLSLLRNAYDESQREVASDIGTDHSTVSRLERESSTIDLTQLVALARHYKVELKWLAIGRGPIFRGKAGGEPIYIGSAFDVRPCRHAVQLLLQSAPGRCIWLEDHITEINRYGWLCDIASQMVLILPGEVKPGFGTRAVVDFVLNKWDLLGRINLNAVQIEQFENKTLPPELLRKWLIAVPEEEELKEQHREASFHDILEGPMIPESLHAVVKPHFDRIHGRAKAATAKKQDLQTQVASHLERLAKRALKDPDLALRLNALLSEADVLEFGDGKKKRRMEA